MNAFVIRLAVAERPRGQQVGGKPKHDRTVPNHNLTRTPQNGSMFSERRPPVTLGSQFRPRPL